MSAANRSREERLRELERERSLFTQSRVSNADAEPTWDVCYATDEGGLKGKIRVGKEGKHSFVDPAMSAAGYSTKMSVSVNKKFEDVEERGRGYSKETGGSAKGARDSSVGRDVRQKRGTSADAWGKLVNKEQKTRAKYYGTDKTLLILLEEERTRYIQLEAEYHKLLGEVQALQANHQQDLRNTERKLENEQRTLQKALMMKSEESASTQKQLQQWQARYSKESAGWIATTERLEGQVDKLQRLLSETENRAAKSEKVTQELTRSRRELAERLSATEEELRRNGKSLRDREAELLKEKESKMQIETQALQLDHLVSQRDDEVKSLKTLVNRQQAEIDELSQLRSILAETKREVEILSKREKQHLQDLDQASHRERKLFTEIEDLTAQQRKSVGEIEHLNSRNAIYTQDIEHLRAIETKLRQELQDALTRTSQQAEETVQLDRQLRKQASEYARLQQEYADLRTLTADLRTQAQNKDLSIQQQREVEANLRREKDELIVQRAHLMGELQARQTDIADLQARLEDTLRRLESESQQKADLKQTMHQKLVAVSDRISGLQGALHEAQTQLQEFRDTEATLRQALKQRDETIKVHLERIAEMQARQSEMHDRVALDAREREALRQKKKEEMMALQDKFTAAKTAMENEVSALRSQLQQKSMHITSLSDEIARLKMSLSELSADKFRLEARLSELTASESSHARQVSNLQVAIQRKDQEATLMMLKHQALVEQLRRVEEEIATWRSSGARDGEVGRLQSNIFDLSRRLKSQVDMLLDNGAGGGISISRPTTPFSVSGSPSKVGNEGKDASVASPFSGSGGGKGTAFGRTFTEAGLGSYTTGTGEVTTTGKGRTEPRSGGDMLDRTIGGLDDFDTDLGSRQRDADGKVGAGPQRMGSFLNRPADDLLAPLALRRELGSPLPGF
ncbi:hypothetical protein HK104_006935 [Borealophlyctis nickersoniae]|nr:hypothetical protein HK104_006935 [Borealophlyctis nickersoniae]